MLRVAGGRGRSPRGRRFRAIAMGLLVSATLLVGIDRLGELLAARMLAGNIASNEHLDHRPHVTIRGFPFLTQLIRGRYHDVDIGSSRPIGSEGIDIDRPDVRLYGVEVGFTDALRGTVKDVPVRSGTGTALVTYPELNDIVHRFAGSDASLITLTSAGDGSARVNGSLGLSVTVSCRVVDGRLMVSADPADLAPLPDAVKAQVQRATAEPIPLPAFPFNVRLASGRITTQGLQLTASANDSLFPTR